MPAITVTINANPFPSFALVATADTYLSADVERYATWAAADANGKGRALASATRLLQRLTWATATPATDGTAPQAVSDACCLLAGDMLSSPELFSNPDNSTSNVRSAGAGSAKVEFFRPVRGVPLPRATWELLRNLLDATGGLTSAAWGVAGGTDVESAFDTNDYAPGTAYP